MRCHGRQSRFEAQFAQSSHASATNGVRDFRKLSAVGGGLLGIGFGLSIPMVNHIVVERSDEAARGRNLAYLAMANLAGQFLSYFLEVVPGTVGLEFLGASVPASLAIAGLTSHGVEKFPCDGSI